MMSMWDEPEKVNKPRPHKDALMISCPSCGHSGLSNVFDEIGKLRAVCFLIVKSIFTGGTIQLKKNELPYGFERNHYCNECGCYIGTSGKVRFLPTAKCFIEKCQDTLRVRCLLCCQVLQCNRADTTALVYHIREAHPEVTLQQSSDEFHQSSAASLADVRDQVHQRSGSAHDRNFVSALSTHNLLEEDKKDTKALEQEILDTIKEVGQRKKTITVDDLARTLPNSQEQNMNNSESRKSIDKDKPAESKETQVLYKRRYKFKKPLTFHRSGKRKLYRTSIEKWRPGRSTIVCPECGANKRPMIKSQVDKVSHSPIGAAFILTCWPFCFLPCLFPPPTKEYLHCAVCNHFLGIYDRKTEVINPNQDSLKSPHDDMTTSTDVTKIEQTQILES